MTDPVDHTLVASPKAILETAAATQYLTFLLHDELYGIELQYVREIISHTKPTPVPMMPPFMLGVINLRGHAVPVIDLSQRFEGLATTIQKRSCVVILDGNNQEFGIITDAVKAVISLNPNQIEPPPNFGLGLRHNFTSGMAKDENGFTVLLDVNRLFLQSDAATSIAVQQSLSNPGDTGSTP